MTTYAIGDVQGCARALEHLLTTIEFDPAHDTLWFTGDLINRGPESLEALRLIKNLGEKHRTVLGNHDLHLLALAYGVRKKAKGDTLEEILQAPDKIELIEWLRHQPILYRDEQVGYTLVHAGIAPRWDIQKALKLAKEIETVLQSDDPRPFLTDMYGNYPDKWDDALSGIERLRCIVNHFTRMRFCHLDGRLELAYKGSLESQPADMLPWFKFPNRATKDLKIIFGHWAALAGSTGTPNTYVLDTGCVWGYALTAMRLEDEKRISIPCHSF